MEGPGETDESGDGRDGGGALGLLRGGGGSDA